MNTNIKIGVALVAGAALGAFGGYSVAKQKYEAKAEEEIEAIRNFYLKREDRQKKAVEGAKKALDEYSQESLPNKTEFDASTIKTRHTDYAGYSRTSEEIAEALKQYEHPEEDDAYEEPDSEEARELFETEQLNEARKNAPDPKIIKMEDYGEGDDIEESVLFYYSGDDTLVTEDDEIVDDPYALIGDALVKYDFKHSRETSIFVRNFKRGVDYEIIKYDGTYSDNV